MTSIRRPCASSWMTTRHRIRTSSVTELLPVLATAFVTGLLGSAHCFGMCGGISGLFAVNVHVASLKNQFPKAIAYNAGRILSYALLGAAVAVIGNALVSGIPDIAA